MKVWVGNLPPEATADEVKQRLVKHGFPECTAMQPVPGAGTRPGMAVECEGAPAEGIPPLHPADGRPLLEKPPARRHHRVAGRGAPCHFAL